MSERGGGEIRVFEKCHHEIPIYFISRPCLMWTNQPTSSFSDIETFFTAFVFFILGWRVQSIKRKFNLIRTKGRKREKDKYARLDKTMK